ncbi:MAG TPA: hypothetical protein VK797_18190, partial [Tepidisphaeraceae bacterium]|nr:hypothetical protein [Tepidisphaeraceae bacterium]
NFVSGSIAPTREPASTRPVGNDTLTAGRPHFHPLRVRRRLMNNFVVESNSPRKATVLRDGFGAEVDLEKQSVEILLDFPQFP